VPDSQVRRLEGEAAASGVYQGTYIAQLVLGRDPAASLALAALGHVIAIYETLRESGNVDAKWLHDLRLLVRDFARLAWAEATREPAQHIVMPTIGAFYITAAYWFTSSSSFANLEGTHSLRHASGIAS